MSPLNRIDQIGIVVRDLDAAAAGMRRVLGAEPHTRVENTYRRTTYRGTEIDATVGVMLYDVGGIELEFLAPRSPGNVWQDFLDERGEGLHHIRFDVDSHAAARDDLHARGVETYQEGESMRGGEIRYAYYDTVPFLGFLIETLNAGGKA
ncbi:VOC family protein [Amycolatopsis endophytica]|uniref:Catechol 2,3-dioxygenase-like lactoylglutathione lyase family enzyme n=1 Tax=Amycolatopsis endophytica TaxID=860233 RepID=A0A853AWD0_9PSEU|nr:VOC family protein [Amycolatopsis endophytica]NYI86901.1 catechol 2,3-dioxygenase-like lactoylglutathione lyase family enzyme [Amycolatopsis endophytica]